MYGERDVYAIVVVRYNGEWSVNFRGPSLVGDLAVSPYRRQDRPRWKLRLDLGQLERGELPPTRTHAGTPFLLPIEVSLPGSTWGLTRSSPAISSQT